MRIFLSRTHTFQNTLLRKLKMEHELVSGDTEDETLLSGQLISEYTLYMHI